MARKAAMRAVNLNPSGEPPLVLTLRQLTGADELALVGVVAASALALLDRLADGADLTALTVSQADRALAGIYLMLYGSQAECRAACESCGESYDFTLELTLVIADQDAIGGTGSERVVQRLRMSARKLGRAGAGAGEDRSHVGSTLRRVRQHLEVVRRRRRVLVPDTVFGRETAHLIAAHVDVVGR